MVLGFGEVIAGMSRYLRVGNVFVHHFAGCTDSACARSKKKWKRSVVGLAVLILPTIPDVGNLYIWVKWAPNLAPSAAAFCSSDTYD